MTIDTKPLSETRVFLLAEAADCESDEMPVTADHYRRAAAAIDALDAKDALLREAREDVGLLVRQLTAMANNAERLGQPIWHSSSPVAEQIAKVDFLLSKLTEATKP